MASVNIPTKYQERNANFHVENMKSTNGSLFNNIDNDNSENEDSFTKTWGFPLAEVYKSAVKFIRDKEGKAMQLSYHDKLKLVAYSQQASHGPYQPEFSPPVGVLDVIGKDRRQAWQSLNNMSKEEAMEKYVTLLDSICPLFKPFIQAHKYDLEEKKRLRHLDEERKRQEEEEQERLRLEEEAQKREEQEKQRIETQKHLIQEALNQQTYHQFKAYAEQQYPGNPEQQAVLIRQLQEEHYEQYMQQVYRQQQENLHRQIIMESQEPKMDDKKIPKKEEGESSEEEAFLDMPNIAPPSMWNRKDIKDFKDSIRKEGGDSIIKVGHGETVTVRVPTHENGTCLFWEFATDSYDIGFGVHFEWTKTPENEKQDIEKGDVQVDRPPVTVVIPIYRRDCHEEVYAGSHVYPGQGVYLLKFDNSYSLWRSKTLYYRVYYTH